MKCWYREICPDETFIAYDSASNVRVNGNHLRGIVA
jgi:hypothetical protein